MTRTAIRHTLSAIAALALVSAFEAAPASAQGGDWDYGEGPRGQLFSNQAGRALQAPKGLATRQPPQQTTTTQDWRWWQDYGGGK